MYKGQTGSGKTYSMLGEIFDEQLKGIIPRSIHQIFESINENEQDIEFQINCSILEIYKEQLYDLLDQNRLDLKIKESLQKGIYIQGLSIVSVTSEEELFNLIEIGNNNRTVASTKINQLSSRSHSIFMLDIIQRYPNESYKKGKLNLVDLAGSEKVGKTRAQGENLEEAKKINLSLSQLGNVIYALTQFQDHIPYRDSKLTRILQESLGGNFKTSLLVTCSTHSSNMDETISTLNFAKRAKRLQNHFKVNIKASPDALQTIIDQLKQENEQLKKLLGQNNNYSNLTQKIVLQQVDDSEKKQIQQKLIELENQNNDLIKKQQISQTCNINQEEFSKVYFQNKELELQYDKINKELLMTKKQVETLKEAINSQSITIENQNELIEESLKKEKELIHINQGLLNNKMKELFGKTIQIQNRKDQGNSYNYDELWDFVEFLPIQQRDDSSKNFNNLLQINCIQAIIKNQEMVNVLKYKDYQQLLENELTKEKNFKLQICEEEIKQSKEFEMKYLNLLNQMKMRIEELENSNLLLLKTHQCMQQDSQSKFSNKISKSFYSQQKNRVLQSQNLNNSLLNRKTSEQSIFDEIGSNPQLSNIKKLLKKLEYQLNLINQGQFQDKNSKSYPIDIAQNLIYECLAQLNINSNEDQNLNNSEMISLKSENMRMQNKIIQLLAEIDIHQSKSTYLQQQYQQQKFNLEKSIYEIENIKKDFQNRLNENKKDYEEIIKKLQQSLNNQISQSTNIIESSSLKLNTETDRNTSSNINHELNLQIDSQFISKEKKKSARMNQQLNLDKSSYRANSLQCFQNQNSAKTINEKKILSPTIVSSQNIQMSIEKISQQQRKRNPSYLFRPKESWDQYKQKIFGNFSKKEPIKSTKYNNNELSNISKSINNSSNQTQFRYNYQKQF